MKKTNASIAVAILLLLNPFILKAQWNAVRFDQYNTFYKVAAPTSNTVFVTGVEPATSQYFIIRSNDMGNNWDSIPFNTATDTFVLTQLYFFDANTGFAGGLKNGFQVLLKTIDNGNNWTEITPNPTTADNIQSVHFINAQEGVATDGVFLYKTINGGTSWVSEFSTFTMHGLFFEDINNGFASGNNGPAVVMQTSDGGQNWNALLSATDSNLFVSNFNKMDFVNSNVGFTAIENSHMFFRTIDGGATWQSIFIDSIRTIRDFDFVSADTGHVLAEIGWMQEFRILLTVDGGQTWTMEYTTGWNFYGGGVVINAFSFVEQTGYSAASNGLIKKYDPTTTDISQEKLDGISSVYPNPFSTSATLRIADWNKSGMKHDHPMAIRIKIYDALGREVFYSEILTNEMELKRGDLSDGIYVYTIATEKEILAKGKLAITD